MTDTQGMLNLYREYFSSPLNGSANGAREDRDPETSNVDDGKDDPLCDYDEVEIAIDYLKKRNSNDIPRTAPITVAFAS